MSGHGGVLLGVPRVAPMSKGSRVCVPVAMWPLFASTLRIPSPTLNLVCERPSACGGDDFLPLSLCYSCVRSAYQGYGAFNCNPADMVYSGSFYDTESYVLEIATFVLAVMVRFISADSLI